MSTYKDSCTQNSAALLGPAHWQFSLTMGNRGKHMPWRMPSIMLALVLHAWHANTWAYLFKEIINLNIIQKCDTKGEKCVPHHRNSSTMTAI